MSVVYLVVLSQDIVLLFRNDVLNDLLETRLEVLDEVFEDVRLVGLEVQFQEHMVGDNDCQGDPVQRALLDPRLEQVWMVADLLETHEDIHHPPCRLLGLEAFVLVPDHLVVEVLLATTHGTPNDLFRFGRQLGLHVLLESPQEERPQHSVQLLQDLLADWEILLQGLLERDVEPLIEVLKRVKYLGHQEVQ